MVLTYDAIFWAAIVLISFGVGTIIVLTYVMYWLKPKAAKGEMVFKLTGKTLELLFTGKSGVNFKDGRAREIVVSDDIPNQIKLVKTEDGREIGPIGFKNVRIDDSNWINIVAGEGGLLPINIDALNRPSDWRTSPEIEAMVRVQEAARERIKAEVKEELMENARIEEVKKGEHSSSIYESEEGPKWARR